MVQSVFSWVLSTDRMNRRRTRLTLSERRSKDVNIALYRIVEGKGSVVEALATLTGLSVDGVKSRVKRARYDYKESEVEPQSANALDASDRRYLAKMYARSASPEVKEFMGQINSAVRARPDWRSSADPKARVSRKKADT